MLAAWALSTPHAATAGIERVLVVIWCVEEDLGRCALPLTPSDAEWESRLVPEGLVDQDCFAGTPEVSAACLDDRSSLLGGAVEVPVELQPGRADLPPARDGEPALYVRVHSRFVSDDVDASLLRMRVLNLASATILPAAVFFLAGLRIRRAMIASAVLLVPLGLSLMTSLDTTAWTVTGALVTWAAVLTALEPGARWPRGAAALVAVVGSMLALTPVSADPMRTGSILGLSVALAVGLRLLDERPGPVLRRRVFQFMVGAGTAAALWRTFQPIPWDLGLLAGSQPLRNVFMLPGAVGDIVGRGVGLGHADTRMAGWVGVIVIGTVLLLMLAGLRRAGGWARTFALAVAGFAALQATHVVMRVGATMDAGLYTGRHFLPFGLLAVAAAVAAQDVDRRGAQPRSGLLPKLGSAGNRAARTVALVLAVTLAAAHSAALHTQIQRYVADAPARDLWPVEAGWWWELPFGPGAVWAAGSGAFLALALLALPAMVPGSRRTVDTSTSRPVSA